MPMSSSKRTPFQDITNGQNKDPKEAERQRKREYYAKNKDEIAKRRRQARELKKQTTTPLIEDNTICHTPATGQSGVTQLQHITPAEDVSRGVQQNHIVGASTLQSDDCAPVKDQTNNNGLFQDTTNEQKIDSREAERLKKIEWYAKNKEEVAKRRRQARELKKQATTVQIDHQSQVIQEPCIGGIGSSYSGMAKDLTTPCSESVIFDEDHGDWLHSNLTYMGDVRSVKNLQNISTSAWLNGQESFAEICADSQKKRQHESSQQKRQRERERYSSMTNAQKDAWLQNNREHKKLARAHKSPFINSPCTPVMQTQPSRNNGTDLGDTNSDDDLDTADIFEPGEQGTIFEDNLDTIQEELSIHDDDEECRIFSGTGDVFDSFRVTSGVAPSNQNDDPYDFVYHNLPTKHHVLKPVKDCAYCGAMRLQYEGHAFCCRKGKVKIVTPEVPEELRRLFTSQVDDDAKYFRKHIRYFNTHFSFTSLGVTLDKNVSSAAKTGVYTFRAQGALYYKADDLVPGGQGPRHLQLYFYDTDEALEHRVKRSPDLDINIIRKILKILEKNPYVQTFKSIGFVPNLEEYRISLNTDIRLDQRRYNAPTASQVAAMWVEGSDPHNTFDRQVVLYGKGDRPIFIRAYYGCYDPLAYPLFFPGGETGWNRWMPYDGPPSAVQENNGEGTEGEDFQVQYRNSDVHVEQNTYGIADDEDDQEDDEVGSSRKFVSAREY